MDPSRILPASSADSRQDTLDFPSSFFRGDDGSIHSLNASVLARQAFRRFLRAQYGVISFCYNEPFVVLGCTSSTPHAADRPFTVGGFIAIWLEGNDFESNFLAWIGVEGEKEFRDWRRDERPVASMAHSGLFTHCLRNKVPDDILFLYLATHVFTDCVAISWIASRLVVELPRTNDATFGERLKHLPGYIEGMPYDLEFHNGPLHSTGDNGRRPNWPQWRPHVDDNDEAGEKTFSYFDVVELMSSKEVNMLDEFLICSSATGEQKLKAVGRRYQIGRPDGNVAYIDAKQLICVTNDPTIHSNPSVRNHGGGPVLVRCYDWKYPDQSELCGILQFEDLPADRGTHLTKDYLVFVDVFDPLVENWENWVGSDDDEGEVLG
ncbi:hypothetical protein CONLIGDRAFT_691731 [Coniochaeta ligniaria NRRL 30616]|uniref:Uncharacterized protein n=1 Tax=Coniochaeta ligniaria NRRL 30616 TaxID=1408157 RepID=A0A1J7J5J3_9PEZI|nr:hypothetical protein CONLIGDRAFT_691731 [Coniochaeta ligniaria NRRL 30616]